MDLLLQTNLSVSLHLSSTANLSDSQNGTATAIARLEILQAEDGSAQIPSQGIVAAAAAQLIGQAVSENGPSKLSGRFTSLGAIQRFGICGDGICEVNERPQSQMELCPQVLSPEDSGKTSSCRFSLS